MQAEQVRYVSIENEALDRAKSTETRLRARCARLASSMSDLKSEAHTRDCEFSELIKAREELNAIVMGYKSRAAVMEQEENSRLSEISRLQSLLRESSISLAQSNIELAEKDRAMARTQRTADELQSTVRGLEDQKLSVERQLRESIQEVAHLRSISDTATHQADDIVSRSKEGERKAQRELAAERYRSEVAVSEANEKCAEMQRKLQKEFSVRLYQAEEAKHALELELNAAKRAIDALTVKSARSLTESRTLSSDALCRAEGQLEAALKRAAKYERLYNVESAGRKQAIAEQTAKQLENQQLSSSGEIIRLQCQMSTASERLIQFEEANRSLVSRLENAERENEKLSRLQENLEQTLSSKVKDSRLSEVLGSRISDMRQQLSGAIEMLEKVSAKLSPLLFHCNFFN